MRDLGLSSLEKKKLRGDLINVYKYPKQGCKEGRVLPVKPSGRTTGSGHKLKHIWFFLNIKKPFFHCKANLTLA